MNNQKKKFYYRENPSLNVPGYWADFKDKNEVIEDESLLKTPQIECKEKVQLKLDDKFSPANFDVMYKNSLKKDVPEIAGFYYANRDIGAGRGFGNLAISNDIRLGDQGRNINEKPESREQMEQKQVEHRWSYLDKNFQDPRHLIMPFPRGGEMTRKQNIIQVDTMRTNYKEQINQELDRVIKFDYEY